MFAAIGSARAGFSPQLSPREVGTVSTSHRHRQGRPACPSVGFEELLEFPGGVLGIAFNVDDDEIGVVLLGDYDICMPATRSSAPGG